MPGRSAEVDTSAGSTDIGMVEAERSPLFVVAAVKRATGTELSTCRPPLEKAARRRPASVAPTR
jgi:hypothetical protein